MSWLWYINALQRDNSVVHGIDAGAVYRLPAMNEDILELTASTFYTDTVHSDGALQSRRDISL